MNGRIRVLVVALLAGLAALVAPAPAPAAAQPLLGHDVSWPQCPTAVGGFGLPMPPADTQFVIVGLTRGLPFTENPCLADQIAWTRTNAKPAHAYTIPAFPTAVQVTTYGAAGPWSASSRAGRLANVGYAQARFALDSLARVGFAPPVVWIDVEPRPAQPWPASTAENRLIVEGLMRGLRDAGVAYGLYSYTSGWQQIVGSWRLPGVPVWATAGRLDYPTEAQDRCIQPSFSGGRVLLSQWYDDTRDYDMTCGSYRFTALPVPPTSPTRTRTDWNGDWTADVLARRASSGDLLLYPGNGSGWWLEPRRVGTGWNAVDAVVAPGDFTGDGRPDVLARWASTGDLWVYPGDGTGGWLAPVRVGTGWHAVNAIVAPGDFTGDGNVDVLARWASTGDLWVYPGDGRSGWFAPVRVGTGWNAINGFVGPGDFTGDGNVDVLARWASTGDLWVYPGNGTGGWLPRAQVGTGWTVMSAIL